MVPTSGKLLTEGPKTKPNRPYLRRRRAEGSVVERAPSPHCRRQQEDDLLRTRRWPYTLAVVILILLSKTRELTLFHTLCAGGQNKKAVVREQWGEGEEDEDVGRRYLKK